MLTKVCVLVCLLVVVFGVTRNEAGRILAVYPTPSYSHQVAFRPLTLELIKRGHEVVVITTDPMFPKGQAPANLTEIDVHDVSYAEWHRAVKGNADKGRTSEIPLQFRQFLSAFVPIADLQLQNSDLQAILKDKTQKFDLIIAEAVFRPALIFSHVFNAPVIVSSSFGRVHRIYECMGAPTHPLLYPNMQRSKLNNLSLLDKLYELYYYYAALKIFDDNEIPENEVMRKHFGPNTPKLNELYENVHMLFLNTHPIWEGNVPVPPGVIHIWGIYQNHEKALPKDLQTYLDSSKHGVIYMSFGTNVDPSVLPPEIISAFVKVFSKLRYDVLWKWDKDDLLGKSNNIKISKWLPQSDLLRHPKIKVFITQGGLQSTSEAITGGVPLIGVPMLGDQWLNVETYITHKIGVRIDLEDITEENLRDTITTVIEDESYQNNVVKLRTLMNDQPQSGLERAVWWTEYVLRHGGARHLRSPAANMSWSEYLELELVFSLLTGFLVLLSLCIFSVYFTFKYFYSNYVVKMEKLKKQ